MIRTGAQKAFVSAIFSGVPELPWFAENQIPYEPELGISREIFADGKNSCRVSGKPVTVSTLRKLGVQLIQIHGQNDSQQLFDEATHIGYLDLFAHDERCWRITGRRMTRSALSSRRSAVCPWMNRKSSVWSRR